jgi:hypothetical protein
VVESGHVKLPISAILLVPAFLVGYATWWVTKSDPAALAVCGSLLVAGDVGFRMRSRARMPRWLIARETGGTLLGLPLWGIGCVQLVAAVAKAVSR